MNSFTEFVTAHSGIDLSVKNTCNPDFDCDQNSFRSLTMMPISMKNAVWIGSLGSFGIVTVSSKGCGARKTIHVGKYHIDTVDGLETRTRKSKQQEDCTIENGNEKAKFSSFCSIGFLVPR